MTERTVTLVGTKGDRVVLACPGGPFHLATNASLWGSTPSVVDSERLGGLHGEVVKSTAYGPRDLILPIRITQATNSEADNLLEQLTEMVRDVDVDVEIEVETAGTRNTKRSIFARYISGLDGVTVEHFLTDNLELRLRFRAHNPFWLDAVSPMLGTAAIPFDNAIGAGINMLTFDIQPTTQVYPIWTITGVIENVTALNTRTGQSWRFLERLDSASDVLEIHTDPRGETGAFLNGGQRSWQFDAASKLWAFEPGPNTFLVSGLNNSGDQATGTFSVRLQNRYENC